MFMVAGIDRDTVKKRYPDRYRGGAIGHDMANMVYFGLRLLYLPNVYVLYQTQKRGKPWIPATEAITRCEWPLREKDPEQRTPLY